MSTNAQPTPVPATSEFSTVWVMYALFGIGVFIWWPAAIAVVVCHLRQGAAAAGFLASHYRWLIRTFWWSLAGYLAGAALVVIGAWPLLRDVLRSVQQHGDWGAGGSFQLNWSSLFATVGGATVGALVIFCVWCWYIYRVVRGGVRLADAQPAP